MKLETKFKLALWAVVIALWVGIAACMTGCTTSSTASPSATQPTVSASQAIAYGYATITSIRTTAAQSLDAKTITLQEAQRVLDLTNQARAMLDAAQAMVTAGNQAGALLLLPSVTATLVQLKQYEVQK